MHILPLTDFHDNAWAVYQGTTYLGWGMVDDFGFIFYGSPTSFVYLKNPA